MTPRSGDLWLRGVDAELELWRQRAFEPAADGLAFMFHSASNGND